MALEGATEVSTAIPTAIPTARRRSVLDHVVLALHHPERFALDWQEGRTRYPFSVWCALGLTATAGMTVYGLSMGLGSGLEAMLRSAFAATCAAGLAWAIPLPALYIFNALSGSRLSMASTLLLALVTTSWGGLAMVATVPINGFFAVALPLPWVKLAVNVAIFAAVGVAMVDVFRRVAGALEPERGGASTWALALVGAIGLELFHAFDLFDFTAAAR